MEQRTSYVVLRLGGTSNTSVYDTDMKEPRRRARSRRIYKMGNVWGQALLVGFFVTGHTDVATKPGHFYCRICRKHVFVPIHGHHEILPHFQGSKLFSRDQRLRLETPGWEVLDYGGKAMDPAEVERQRETIMRAPLVERDKITFSLKA